MGFEIHIQDSHLGLVSLSENSLCLALYSKVLSHGISLSLSLSPPLPPTHPQWGRGGYVHLPVPSGKVPRCVSGKNQPPQTGHSICMSKLCLCVRVYVNYQGKAQVPGVPAASLVRWQEAGPQS